MIVWPQERPEHEPWQPETAIRRPAEPTTRLKPSEQLPELLSFRDAAAGNGATTHTALDGGPFLTAEAIERADRIAQDARALLHHDSDDEPLKAAAEDGNARREIPAIGGSHEAERHAAAQLEVALGPSLPAAPAAREHASSHATAVRRSSGIEGGIVGGRQTATTAGGELAAASRRIQNGRNALPADHAGFPRSRPGFLPDSSFSQYDSDQQKQHDNEQVDVEPTPGGSRELTLKLSLSGNQNGSADAAGAVPVGTAAVDAMRGEFAGFAGASAPSEPPLTLVLTPASGPTQSSTEGLGAAAAAPDRGGEQLTLVLSPDGSSRGRDRSSQRSGLVADAGSDSIGAGRGSSNMVLSSGCSPALLPHADGRSEAITGDPAAPGLSTSSVRHQQNSQPENSSGAQQPQQGVSIPRVDRTARPVGSQDSPLNTVSGAESGSKPASDSPARTAEGQSPAPQGGVQGAGPESGGSARRRTPEESPLPLGQSMPALRLSSGSIPAPGKGTLLRSALVPEGTPGGGGGGGGHPGRSVRRRMSSQLARASSNRPGYSTELAPHDATGDRARGQPARGAQRWQLQGGGGLSTVREAPDGPGRASLRNPPPTQACIALARRLTSLSDLTVTRNRCITFQYCATDVGPVKATPERLFSAIRTAPRLYHSHHLTHPMRSS